MISKFKWIFLMLLIPVFLLATGCGNQGEKGQDTTTAYFEEDSEAVDDLEYFDDEYEEGDVDDSEEWVSSDEGNDSDTWDNQDQGEKLDESGSYTTKEDVMNYLIQYDRLPDNFITKKEARSLGWSGGGLDPYAPGKCIGGDRFSNYEENLPVVKGRKYYECDIDTLGAKKRGAKRIVYSDDGNIYYTDDHYETFTLLYGDDGQ